jgi:hypothetical protein
MSWFWWIYTLDLFGIEFRFSNITSGLIKYKVHLYFMLRINVTEGLGNTTQVSLDPNQIAVIHVELATYIIFFSSILLIKVIVSVIPLRI